MKNCIAKWYRHRGQVKEREALTAKLDSSGPDGLDKDAAAKFCDMIGRRLQGLSGDFEGKRRILGLLVNKVVVQGKTVRIKGIIPASSGEAEAQVQPCHIASPTHWRHGRNTASFEFELETAIP